MICGWTVRNRIHLERWYSCVYIYRYTKCAHEYWDFCYGFIKLFFFSFFMSVLQTNNTMIETCTKGIYEYIYKNISNCRHWHILSLCLLFVSFSVVVFFTSLLHSNACVLCMANDDQVGNTWTLLQSHDLSF